MAPIYQLRIDTTQLRVLVARTATPLGDPKIVHAMGQSIRKWGALVQARAVRNVTGYPVVYEGGVFRVQVVTGTLRGAVELQWPYGTVLRARVFVNGSHSATSVVAGRARTQSVANYASAIEQGHKEIDLKQFMMGRVVPFFAARAQNARGPYAGTGATPMIAGATGIGSSWKSEELNRRLQAKGKSPMSFTRQGGTAAYKGSGSTYLISFRRVGRTGWIIPAAKPRPFMKAALTSTTDQGRLMMIKDLAPIFDPRT